MLGCGLLGERLTLIGFEDLHAALFECFASTKLGERLVGLEAVLFALLAEVIDDLGCQRLGPFDGDFLEFFTDAGGAERGVPIGVDIGSGDVKLVA